GSPGGITDSSKEWWVQAEAVVGFYNAYQKTGEIKFADAAYRVWSYINDKMVDRKYGDWLKRLFRDGTPDLERYKAGPWECPYHHSRMCFEMITRLEA
ncbi:MAG: AGE family epimerase/isomerase, partial [Calditrichota bacterium]